jgi:glycosyltransferase involved in cell wall biosynthesis
MAVGCPVVSSPVGSAVEIVEPGISGLLASSEANWLDTLSSLAGAAARRRTMGRAARQRVVDDYSIEAALPRLVAALEHAAD